MKWYCSEQEYKFNGNLIEKLPSHYDRYVGAVEPLQDLLNVIDQFLDRGVDKYKFKERIKKKKKIETANKSTRAVTAVEQELLGGKSPPKHAAAKNKTGVSSGA
jgi:hypothetical protein